jgi:hypothetical protein
MYTRVNLLTGFCHSPHRSSISSNGTRSRVLSLVIGNASISLAWKRASQKVSFIPTSCNVCRYRCGLTAIHAFHMQTRWYAEVWTAGSRANRVNFEHAACATILIKKTSLWMLILLYMVFYHWSWRPTQNNCKMTISGHLLQLIPSIWIHVLHES